MIGNASSIIQKRSVHSCVAQRQPRVGVPSAFGGKLTAHAQVTRARTTRRAVLGKKPALPIHQARRRRGRHGGRVETCALMPMYGSACAVAVALQASKAKLPVLIYMGKASAPPIALFAGAVLAVVASHFVSKGLKPDDEENNPQQGEAQPQPQSQWDMNSSGARFT